MSAIPPGATAAFSFGEYFSPGDGYLTTLAIVPRAGVNTYWKGRRIIEGGSIGDRNEAAVEMTLEEFRRAVQRHIELFQSNLP